MVGGRALTLGLRFSRHSSSSFAFLLTTYSLLTASFTFPHISTAVTTHYSLPTPSNLSASLHPIRIRSSFSNESVSKQRAIGCALLRQSTSQRSEAKHPQELKSLAVLPITSHKSLSPAQSALTQNPPITRLESALPKHGT